MFSGDPSARAQGTPLCPADLPQHAGALRLTVGAVPEVHLGVYTVEKCMTSFGLHQNPGTKDWLSHHLTTRGTSFSERFIMSEAPKTDQPLQSPEGYLTLADSQASALEILVR